MANIIRIKNKIKSYKKNIYVDGDKSLSIRWALMASQAMGTSKAYNLLRSEDVLSTLNCLKKLGIKINLKKKFCEITGNGLNNFDNKKNIKLNAGNSGTLGRLILGMLAGYPKKIMLKGDKSLSKRDFSRIINPLKEFGVQFFPKNKNSLPIYFQGTRFLRPIKYFENKGSAQCKSSVMLAALNSPGKTIIKAKKSRNHTEILFKYLKIPIKIIKKKDFDFIEIFGEKNYMAFNYNVPSDISSSAFFIVLTLLSKNSNLIIKNININPGRIGFIKILNKMGAKIRFNNTKYYKGEKIADIYVQSAKFLKGINVPKKFNSSAIDEFLILFLAAAKAKGVSYFKDISELNKKESPRLKLGSKILNMIGVKNKLTDSSIKIYGQPNLILEKKYEVKNFFKDHRIFMMSTIAALCLGGNWKIHNSDSANTSFPSFLKIIKKLGGKIY